MDKYRKVVKPREQTVKDDDEIRVTAAGSVSAYVAYAAKVFNEMEKPKIVVKGTGNALSKVVTAAEVIKRRFKGLHQVTNLGSTEIVDEYEPLEEGLDKVVDTRNVSFIEITLSKEALDTSDKGYQPPLPEDQVKDYDPEEIAKGRGRGRGRGRGKGKSKGKGKSGDSPKGKGKKGKGKGKDASPKGKGKGKGKDASPKGKGKGKDKGKGKGKDASPKGKGKSAGGKGDKSKGKGKSSDYGSWGGGWDSWWEEEYYPAPAKSKGKGKSSKGKGKASSYDDWYDYDSYGPSKSSPKGKGKGSSKGKGKESKGKGKSKSKGKGSYDDYYY